MLFASCGAAVLLSFVLFLANSTASAQQNPMNARTLPSESPVSGTGDNPQAAKDRLFLHNAIEDSMLEEQMSQLALQKSSNEDTKKFAQKVVDENTWLMSNFKPFAKSLGIDTPKKLSKGEAAEYAKLNNLSGADFDKAYVTRIAKEDHRDLDQLRQEAEVTGNPNLKDIAAKGANMIEQHTPELNKLVQANSSTAPVH